MLNSRLFLMLAWLLVIGCSKPPQPLAVTPLSPFQYEFSTPDGLARNDYFFVATDGVDQAQLKQALAALATIKQRDRPAGLQVYSIYVYRKSTRLNRAFRGDSAQLRAYAAADLLAYCRWRQGKIDIFYWLENGRVVFDLLENEPIKPSFEFK